MPSGITYLGKHSYNDLGVTMAIPRQIGIPNKKKTKLSIPFSNVVYDYSNIFGSQAYEERTIKYTFNIANRSIKTKEQMNWVKTEMINWLMNSGGKQPLYDDFYNAYYFLAEVEGGSSFTENWDHGFLEVTFTAYPFMISKQPEGNDDYLWDDFNFLYDISQETTFNIPASKEQYTPLAIGSQATIAAWATAGLGGTPGQLANYIGVTGTILSRQEVDTSYSSHSYTVQGFDDPILEQDIIQACTKYVDVVLVNNGTPSLFPELSLTISDEYTPKVSIENLDTNTVYNFTGSTPDNYIFQLNPGENKLRLYGLHDQTIEFIYRKELI